VIALALTLVRRLGSIELGWSGWAEIRGPEHASGSLTAVAVVEMQFVQRPKVTRCPNAIYC
jgi:hypothetical protein